MPDDPAVSPSVLSYGDPITQQGYAAVHRPELVRVVVPPISHWRSLGIGFRVGTFLLAGMTIMGLGLILSGDPNSRSPGIFNTALYGGGFLIMIYFALYYRRRRIVFDITANQFSVTYVGPFRSETIPWPRTFIQEAHITVTGKLHLRIDDQDPLEIYLGPNRERNEWVAKELTDALASPPTMPCDVPAIPSPTLRTRNKWGAGISGITFIIGAVLYFCGSFYTPIGFGLVIISTIAAGLTFGSQDKDFYF